MASRFVVPRLRSTGSVDVGTQAQLLRGLWDLPGPGIKVVSPALAIGFLSTGRAGKWDRGASNIKLTLTTTVPTYSIGTCVPLHDVPLEGCMCSLGSDTEAPVLWSPDDRSQLIGKDPDSGKD